ncbi:MAG: hypothetical protein IJ880_15730 [Bacilli bacterium]|nr:hypothetical protein [Bacilli bacterium]
MFVMEESITINGRRYKLVPIGPFDRTEPGLELSTTAAEEKADLYRSKYNDYKNIPRQELISRIIRIDQMSELEYCLYSVDTWTNWEELYKAVKTQIICPYKSLTQFRQMGLDLVKEAFERKESIATGYFEVKYYDGYEDDDQEWVYPEITLNVVFYGSTHTLDEKDRDYLVPEDDQTYNNAG